jgi:DNA repair protein RecO (recombination protein O)
MDEKTSGLILRTRPLTETSLIVHWLTPDLGRVATVAKGARRPKSPFRGKLDIFHRADFSFARSRRSELHTLREVILRDSHRALREDLHLLQRAAYGVQLIEQTTEMESPIPEIHQLLSEFLAFLPAHLDDALPVYAFELKLLGATGLQPDLARTDLSAGTREVMERMAGADWAPLAPLKLSAGQGAELRQFLHGFLIYHLGRVPAGRASALR